MKKTDIKKYINLSLVTLVLLLVAPSLSYPQERNTYTVKGRVVDQESRQPLAGATIRLQGTNNYAFSDDDGHFTIVSDKKTDIVVAVSFIGYQSKEVSAVQGFKEITLQRKGGRLEEVVVVGYGSQKKEDVTGSIAKIDGGEVTKIPVASFDAQLQGKASGLQVVSNSGVPGEGIFVRVRGTTSINSSSDPLYIVDGVFLNNTSLQTIDMGGRTTSPLADINPADIQSIEVLKDASATAIYGSRGANGVIIVTTKKGNYNSKPKISLNLSEGWVQADKSTIPHLISGPESAELANEFWINSGIDNPSLGQTFENRPFRPKSEGGNGLPEEQETYDRIGDLLRKGHVRDYNLGIQGGSETSKYYFGAGYTDQEALIKVIGFSRASLKFNYDQKLTDHISFGVTNSLSRSYRNQARTGDGPQVSLWNSAVSTATYTPKFEEEGGSLLGVGTDNTYTLIQNYDVNTISLRYLGSVYGEAQILKRLKLKSSFSIDYNHYDESAYWNTQTSIGRATDGLATSNITQNSTWINEQTLTYQQRSDGHNLTVLVGNSLESNTLALTAAEGQGFANDNYKLISSASVRTSSQNWTKYTLTSLFGRISYDYLNKYYAEFSARTDGSSKFGSDNRWGYFPAFSLGWRLEQEEFLQDVDWLSGLKLRSSYGITGNQAGINNFAAKGLWSGGDSYADVVDAPLAGIGPQQLGNPGLKWEKTSQTNFGLDLGLFNNRLSVTFDVYHKYTSGLLLEQPIPAATGFSTYWANSGEISNKGFELSINTVNVSHTDLVWTTNLNISGNKNLIEKLPSQLTRYSRDWVIMKEGYSMNSFWLYEQLYVDSKTGASVFDGEDENGAVTTEDRKILHNAYPKFYGGLTNHFSYKGFDLGFSFSFQYGSYTLNLDRYFRERNPLRGSANTISLKRWQNPGDITDVPRFTSLGNNYTIDQNSRYLEDASFVRLKQLSFGYNLPKSVLSALGITNARLFFLGTNLKLWTKYTGDPETNITSDPTAQGIGSFGTPPQPKGFQFGVNLTL